MKIMHLSIIIIVTVLVAIEVGSVYILILIFCTDQDVDNFWWLERQCMHGDLKTVDVYEIFMYCVAI